MSSDHEVARLSLVVFPSNSDYRQRVQLADELYRLSQSDNPPPFMRNEYYRRHASWMFKVRLHLCSIEAFLANECGIE